MFLSFYDLAQVKTLCRIFKQWRKRGSYLLRTVFQKLAFSQGNLGAVATIVTNQWVAGTFGERTGIYGNASNYHATGYGGGQIKPILIYWRFRHHISLNIN
jgi:hypothetical protein